MSAVKDFQAATEQLATATATETLEVYAELTAERVLPDTAALWIAGTINRANAAAVGLADVWLAAQIEEQTGQPTPTVGVLPVDDSDRLVTAVNTVLGGQAGNAGQKQAGVSSAESPTNTADMRLERLARAEPFEAAQRASHDAIQKQPGVKGWVRQMDADPCQLCRWWYRDGRVWPKAHRMPTHKGCNCQRRIVVAQHIQPTAYTRALERNSR